jgi:two-component system, cell cycle sensor histidine kinase and response regulator CckA
VKPPAASAAGRGRSRARPRRAPVELLARALHGLAEGVLIAEPVLGRQGLTVVYANAALCAITGYDQAELVGRGHARLHLAPGDLTAMRRWRRRSGASQPLSGEGYLNHKNGVQVYAAWSFSPLIDARGRLTHVVGLYRDLTEKRRLQEELIHAQRLDAVGRLAGGVAHDFNNLLSVINGYCEILAATLVHNPKAQKEVAEIHQAGQRASTLVRQLLAFGRRQTMDPRVINLNQLIRENFEILRRLLSPDKTLNLALDETIANVRVDPGQLQQVLLNLTINARDAVPPGGQVTLGTSGREIKGRTRRGTDLPPGRYVVLSVSDNGSGMDAATRAHLFEPFFSTKGEGRGTGLGLALVYGVVEQSGGHILVHSVPRLGSTFEILLPGVQEPAAARDGLVPTLPITKGRETILLVEEDDVVRKMVAGILTADGYRVMAAASAADALMRARRHRDTLHLVIIDCSRRGEEGHRLVQALRKTRPSLRILCTTGQDAAPLPDVPDHQQTVVTKPFALSTLLRAVRALLDAPEGRSSVGGAGR